MTKTKTPGEAARAAYNAKRGIRYNHATPSDWDAIAAAAIEAAREGESKSLCGRANCAHEHTDRYPGGNYCTYCGAWVS